MLGVGVMLYHLGGGSAENASTFYGRLITGAAIVDNKLRIAFADGPAILLFDNGQSCCEHRYMTTDDDLSSLAGHRLTHIEAKSGPDEPAEYDEHETCFVEIATDVGFVTLTNHNEHNGYYGGFGLTIQIEEGA